MLSFLFFWNMFTFSNGFFFIIIIFQLRIHLLGKILDGIDHSGLKG
jgi:hypothetical protein